MGEILSQITRIDNNIQNALAKVAAKGVTVSADAGSDELPGLIEQISQAEDLDSVLDAQEAKLNALLSSLDGKAAGGGAGTDLEDAIVSRTISGEYRNNRVTSVGFNAFANCNNLVSAYFPEVTTIGTKAFNGCGKLERVEFPKLTTITAGDNFTYCYELKYVDLGLAKSIPSWCLANNKKLVTVILRKPDGVCTLAATNALSGSGVESGIGYVYVPAAIVDSYKAATNWSTYAAQIRAIEDYPEICG